MSPLKRDPLPFLPLTPAAFHVLLALSDGPKHGYLIIKDVEDRTSGEVRLSWFLPWQGAHSELYFTDVYWPELRELDFLRALRTYQHRRRRFGR